MNVRSSKALDITVGLFVSIGLGAIAYLSLSVGGLNYPGRGGTPLFARFDDIADLRPRAPVQLAGVKVGQVTKISLDDYRARVDLEIDPHVKLPVDTSASIVTAGLLGDRYILLQPGAEDDFLADGDEIAYTESALVLERMVGKFLVNVDEDEDEE